VHFNGPVVRPGTDADSVFIEVTVGCTHDSGTFCNFYNGLSIPSRTVQPGGNRSEGSIFNLSPCETSVGIRREPVCFECCQTRRTGQAV
jgi:hypothetical protein